jgi:hypothetical protein
MKRFLLELLCVATVAALIGFLAAFAAAQDVSPQAMSEIARRGSYVEAIGPPADDSHKWFVSVLTQPNCASCERLKNDFANSPHLRPFVNVQTPADSWAHYHVFNLRDETQSWRWKGLKLKTTPTIILQPPVSGDHGNPTTVVLQLDGYDGDAKKLADTLRAGIRRYTEPEAGALFPRLFPNRPNILPQPTVVPEPTPTVEPPPFVVPPPEIDIVPPPVPDIAPEPAPATEPEIEPAPEAETVSDDALIDLVVSLLGKSRSESLDTILLIVIVVLTIRNGGINGKVKAIVKAREAVSRVDAK